MRLISKGSKNKRHFTNTYIFINKQTSQIFVGTLQKFQEETKLNNNIIYSLIHNTINEYNYWISLETNVI